MNMITCITGTYKGRMWTCVWNEDACEYDLRVMNKLFGWIIFNQDKTGFCVEKSTRTRTDEEFPSLEEAIFEILQDDPMFKPPKRRTLQYD